MSKYKVPVHIEVAIKPSCLKTSAEIKQLTCKLLESSCPVFENGAVSIPSLDSIVDSMLVCDLSRGKRVSFWQAEPCVHCHRLSDQEPSSDFLDGEETLSAAEQWELPNAYLVGLWDSIVIDDALKNRLLSYCSSSIQFADAKIDTNIISWNKMVLLHGPPGTGKTTVCKALAQKMYIRNSDRYSSGVLLEVNSHSLFSKWFSESGKLVMKLFSHIGEIADDEECLVIVLIDEIESIAAARSSSSRSNEPGDAVRVVNAVLTSLDALKRRPNVLLLSTSNMMNTIDPAFLDRVDLKIYLGPPSLGARYSILLSCLKELTGKGIIQPPCALSDDWRQASERLTAALQKIAISNGSDLAAVKAEFFNSAFGDLQLNTQTSFEVDGEIDVVAQLESYSNIFGDLAVDLHLFVIAHICEGMSGRSLRKLPIKAHSYFLQRPTVTLGEFLCAVHATVNLDRNGRNGEDDLK